MISLVWTNNPNWIDYTDRLTHLIIVTNTSSLPSSIVTTRITLIQLEPKMWIPSHVQDRNTKWTKTCRQRCGREVHNQVHSSKWAWVLLTAHIRTLLCTCAFSDSTVYHMTRFKHAKIHLITRLINCIVIRHFKKFCKQCPTQHL